MKAILEVFTALVVLGFWYIIFISIPSFFLLIMDYIKFLKDYFKGDATKFKFQSFNKRSPELFKRLSYTYLMICLSFHFIFFFLVLTNKLKISNYLNFFLDISFSLVGTKK